MVALASSKEEVLEQLKADIYAKNEVWDFSKVCFSPSDFEFVVCGLEEGAIGEVWADGK
jgi:hypothetical protein